MLDLAAFDSHESVTFFADSATGLQGVVAIHSTVLGPAFGGCRAWTYSDSTDALIDALRLSRGMTFKNAMAGLPFGGGKAVLLRGVDQVLGNEQFEAFGRVVHNLGGRYITAEDVGVSVQNMLSVSTQTPYVSGLPDQGSPVAGDPSPKTAYGVFCGIRAAVRARFESPDLSGVRVAVQGLGHVGQHLCAELHKAGAKLVVADINPQAVRRVVERYGATAVSVDEILFQDVEVLAPCALGGILDEEVITNLRTSIVAGGANNQLKSDRDGQRLFDRGILYAPDYVINGGGIIAAASEYLKISDMRRVMERIGLIDSTLTDIFAKSVRQGSPTNMIADAMARAKIASGAPSLPPTRLAA